MGLQDIKKRVRSVESTHKLTSAMKLIAASRLRQATRLLTSARAYETSLRQTLQASFRTLSPEALERCRVQLPWYYTRQIFKKPHIICVIGAHSGLCGGYHLLSVRETLAEEARTVGRQDYSIVPFSAKTAEYFAKNRPEKTEPLAGLGHFGKKADNLDVARYVLEHMERWFHNDEAGSVVVVSGYFKSALVQQVETFQLFPLLENVLSFQPSWNKPEEAEKNEPDGLNVIEAGLGGLRIEPSHEEALEQALRHFALVRLYRAFLESEACECSARMTMMESAKRNAEELIDKLSLQYNRTRQANITNELIEIIAGTSSMAAE